MWSIRPCWSRRRRIDCNSLVKFKCSINVWRIILMAVRIFSPASTQCHSIKESPEKAKPKWAEYNYPKTKYKSNYENRYWSKTVTDILRICTWWEKTEVKWKIKFKRTASLRLSKRSRRGSRNRERSFCLRKVLILLCRVEVGCGEEE